ncbi:Transmembrane protein [Sulfitobacter noctilucicola]|uniref:Drug/metabolite transporter (DMT)-like permease n=1 Tax=Sulfitobacter noctilucicola TaxID=1342301 RepID=A0A7W6M7I2_9RHOB|nr:DMT family transporter [Sulfitobacter noctilucicola]KIN62364.1 Transmembrane protein [Sulfitobacter noctilucicola]MBB4173102.1 drug/metabolite transporter (DMT)-like permease [Sulfitobacter noctilucicola]
MTDQTKGLLITFFGVLFVVPDSLFVRLIEADALTIAFWRLAFAGGLSAFWILALQGTEPFHAVLRTGRFAVIYMIGIGASGILFVVAVSLTSVANVVFIIASLPVFALVFSRIFLREPLSPRTLLTIAAVVPGLAIIAYGSGETENASLAGDLLALCVSALFAASLTAARHVRPVSMVAGMAMAYSAAALLVLPFAHPLLVPVEQFPLVMAHGLFILLSSVLLAIGPRFITSAEVGLLVLLESVLAPLLAWVVIAENPGIYTLIGGGIVVGALFVSNAVLLLRRKKSVGR